MKILVTGNMGYIGGTLVRSIHEHIPDPVIIGVDAGYFAHCLTNTNILPECLIDVQYFQDIRNMDYSILDGVDAVVHLAAISNDPMGNQFAKVTADINSTASKKLAVESKKRGVKRFVFASSCSMYGFAEGGARTEEDQLNPLTAYANSKVFMEKSLRELADENFITTSLRFSTACGMTDRLRLDLVLNDFVACAVTTKKITVLSDGTPWRPLIDVKDMCRSMIWGLQRELDNGSACVAVNVGANSWNYQVKDLAEAVSRIISGTEVSIDADAQPDKRSYQVDFSKYKELAPDFQPVMRLEDSIRELQDGLIAMNFKDGNFRNSSFMRLKVLQSSIEAGVLDKNLLRT